MDRRRIDPLPLRSPHPDRGRRAQAAASDGLRSWRMVLRADRPKAGIVCPRSMPLRRHEDYRRAYRQHAARNASRGVPAQDPTQSHRCLSAAPGAMRILEGDALACLRKLPDESVQMCVTSPPYWGLRDYSIPKQPWGGDPSHSHEWGAIVVQNASTNHVDKRRWAHAVNGRGEEQPVEKRVGGDRKQIAQGAFCECGAWLGSLGLEPTPELYTAHIVEVFREVKRVLRADGTLWLNLGDSYASGKGTCFNPGGGSSSLGQGRKAQGVHPLDRGNKSTLAASGLKCKDLVGIPWRVAFALQADGWYLRSDIIWEKRNPMPESVRDRPTKAHEYIFLLSKSATYYYDADAIKEPCSPDTHARYGKASRAYISRDAQHPHEANGKARKLATPGSGIKNNSSFDAAMAVMPQTRNKRR